jgi:hypothetical protein
MLFIFPCFIWTKYIVEHPITLPGNYDIFREINVLTNIDKVKVLKMVAACGIFSKPVLRKPDERKSIEHCVS